MRSCQKFPRARAHRAAAVSASLKSLRKPPCSSTRMACSVVPPGEVTCRRNIAGSSEPSSAILAAPYAVCSASSRAVACGSPCSVAACSSASMTRKKYAGPLPESAVTRSSCSSCSTHTVTPTARRMDSACSRMTSFTSALAYRPQAPAPTSTAVLGITRTTGRFPPSQRSRSPMRTPAATETTSGCWCCATVASAVAAAANACGLTANTRISARAATAALSAWTSSPEQLRHAITLRGVGIRENQAAAVPAAVDKATGEGARYVAGADESDQRRVVGGGG